MVFKLVELASQRWQKLHSSNIIPLLLGGMKYRDGIAMDAGVKDGGEKVETEKDVELAKAA